MRHATVLLLALVLAVPSVAQELGARTPEKIPQSYPENVPDPALQGGDTIASAVVIPALPYNDSGTTVGYDDDYDEVCPYSGATAPDVVYRYVSPTSEPVIIDLCGSTYDTKLYVYDAAMNLIDCNDDFYFGEPCGIYVSKLENVNLQAGGTYYIIIDGYASASGAYILHVENWCCFCPVPCPDGGLPEGEPPLVDDYVDNWNGGCNTDPGYPFQSLAGDANGELTLCGVSGWYTFQGSQYPDTDWYILTMGASGNIDIAFQTEFEAYIFELGPQECGAVSVLQQATVGNCDEGHMTIGGYIPGAPVWFWVGPTVFSPPYDFDEFNYVTWFAGLESSVATEATSWSSVKALYD